MPEVLGSIPVRYADVAAPWLATAGADPLGTVRAPAIVARVALRYDDEKADLVHDEEYEAVLFPISRQLDVSQAIAVDYDERDLQTDVPAGCTYRLTDAPIANKTFWSGVERDLVDHLVRSRTVELQVNKKLKLYSRPGETPEAFAQRCAAAADDLGDAETAKLRDKYEARINKLQTDLQAANDKAELLHTQRRGRQSEEILSTASSVLGSLFGGRKSRKGVLGSVLGSAGGAAGRRSRTAAAGDRVQAQENKIQQLHDQLEDLEQQVADDVQEIDTKWDAVAADIGTLSVPLERSDVNVTQLALVWLPAR